MCRIKSLHIYVAIGDLRAIQILLGHSYIENTVHHLGVDIDDAPVHRHNICHWSLHELAEAWPVPTGPHLGVHILNRVNVRRLLWKPITVSIDWKVNDRHDTTMRHVVTSNGCSA